MYYIGKITILCAVTMKKVTEIIVPKFAKSDADVLDNMKTVARFQLNIHPQLRNQELILAPEIVGKYTDETGKILGGLAMTRYFHVQMFPN